MKLANYAAVALLSLPLATAAEPASGSVQDVRQIVPGQLRPGAVAIQGEIINGAADGAWIEIHILSDGGWFICRLTRISSSATVFPPEARIPMPTGALPSRTIAWSDVNQPRLRVYGGASLWLEGGITAISQGGDAMEGVFAFRDGNCRLRLDLIENVVYDSNPPPTFSNVAYGADPKQVMDVYLTPRRRPAPVAVFLHGGGWVHFDKSEINHYPFHTLLDAGISVVSIDYRFCPIANPNDHTPAVSLPMLDAAHGIQFVRRHAKAWGIVGKRLGVWGESAGACTALWLGTHPDLADPAKSGAVEGESTRPWCVATVNPQTSLDPLQMREWAGPNISYGPYAFGIHAPGGPAASFAVFMAARDRLLPLIDEYSPAALLSRDGPPIYLDFHSIPITPVEPPEYTHSPRFGIGFYQLSEKVGRECYLRYWGRDERRYGTWLAFMIAKLRQ